jgi:hypothetical protein
LLPVSPPDSRPVASPFDSDRKIEKEQYHGCNIKLVDDRKWEDIVISLLHLEKISALGIGKENSHLILRVDEKTEPLTPEQFLWIAQQAAWKYTIKKDPLPMEKSRRGF